MIIQETGEIDDGFYVVGSASVPVYLLAGPVSVLFDAGLTAGEFLYEAGIRQVLGERVPEYLFLTHSRDAVSHIENSFHAARDYLIMTEKFLVQERGEVEKAVELVKKSEWDPRSWPKQPESAYLLNTWSRVNTIWNRMNRN